MSLVVKDGEVCCMANHIIKTFSLRKLVLYRITINFSCFLNLFKYEATKVYTCIYVNICTQM